ncbi:MAG: hypothetical protein M3R14_08670 [Acidobacteriota bacterium]|nr:hypothetical protein [Acidobacteriota bacterium]
MNKTIATILLVLCFAMSVFTQSLSITKGSTVVPKFVFRWSDLDKSLTGLKLRLKIEQNSSGNLTINGNEDWRAIPLFPAYDEGESIMWKDYRRVYTTSSIVAYKVSGIERKKEFTEVNLSKINDRIVDIKLQFGNSIKDVEKAFSEVTFLGGVGEFTNSEYYQNLYNPNLDREMGELPKEINEVSNQTEIFKEKKYLVSSYLDKRAYNSNRVNQTERTARIVQEYFPVIKKKEELLLSLKEIDGIKLEVKIAFRDFVDKSSRTQLDELKFYVSKDVLKLFIDADITDQELIDKSIILLNDNRVRVNLSQFSK